MSVWYKNLASAWMQNVAKRLFDRKIRALQLISAYVSDRRCGCDEFISNNLQYLPVNAAISVDLGAGSNPQNPFGLEETLGVDCNPSSSGLIFDLSKGELPFDNSSVSCITAFHFMEHCPRVAVNADGVSFNPFIALVEEIWRVLVEGGLFLSVTPAYPFGAAFSDPTHVNFITEKTFRSYLSGVNPIARQYGYSARFDFIDQAWDGEALMSLIKKT